MDKIGINRRFRDKYPRYRDEVPSLHLIKHKKCRLGFIKQFLELRNVLSGNRYDMLIIPNIKHVTL